MVKEKKTSVKKPRKSKKANQNMLEKSISPTVFSESYLKEETIEQVKENDPIVEEEIIKEDVVQKSSTIKLYCCFCREFHSEKRGRDATSTWCPSCGKCIPLDWREVDDGENS